MGVGAGLYVYVVVVQKFTFAISSPDEFLLKICNSLSRIKPNKLFTLDDNINGNYRPFILGNLLNIGVPGEPKKNPPLRLLLILQQCMGIFVRNFTLLLSDQIYTLSPSFIEIFLELTKLHSFNHDNPHFTR